MKVNVAVIERLVGFPLTNIDSLVTKINSQLGGVEEVINLADRYRGATIVKVAECEKHPDADRLHITKIDDGRSVLDVPRDENGLVQVVCGAPNVHAGMWAIWLPPGSTVPASIVEGDPFVLGARKLRGVLSQGMMAAADELALGSDHGGIVEITEDDLPEGAALVPGASFAEVFGLNTTIIDIENKMFTHRPDLFGQVGVAREIAGIFNRSFVSPEWYSSALQCDLAHSLPLTLARNTDGASRVMAVALEKVTVEPSPLWLQCQIVALGGKPINNIVDLTNYVMLMTAQPLHAYDYDKLAGHTLVARQAQEGESLTLLDGKDIVLTADDIVMADTEKPVGLAGIMGGKDTAVTDDTTRVVIEVATFDMFALRKSAMRHGVFTDALTRYNKGQSPLQNEHVLQYFLQLAADAGAVIASPVYDAMTSDVADARVGKQPRQVIVGGDIINSRLGLELSRSAIKQILGNVEVTVAGSDERMVVHVPFWRTDLAIPEDIVEEVGRLYGFNLLPRQLPQRRISPPPVNRLRQLQQLLRQGFVRSGANELVTYSFVHQNTLERAGQDPAHSFTISNALSPDLQYYRQTLLPNLLEKVRPNSKEGYHDFTLFEFGRVYNQQYPRGEKGMPAPRELASAVMTQKKPDGAMFYYVRQQMDELLTVIGIENQTYEAVSSEADKALVQQQGVFAPDRSAVVRVKGTEIGIIGELTAAARDNFRIQMPVAALTIDISALMNVWHENAQGYTPLSKYQWAQRDISIKAAADVSYSKLYGAAMQALQNVVGYHVTIEPLSIYQASHDAADVTTTFRITLTHHDKTPVKKDIEALLEQVSDAVSKQFGASIE